jgi:aspartate/methionine/tyrosine aminotransferase
VYDGSRHVSIGALPGMAERTITAFTFSKSYAMTGWRVGYVVTPPSLRGVMGPILSFYTTHGVFPAAQSACRAAVLGSQDCVEQMRVAYGERRRLMLDGLAGQDAVTVPTPLGTFYVFAHVTLGGRELWSLVEDWLSWGVAVLPGTAFGPEYVDWVRMSLATRSEQVVEAARILRERHAGVRSGVGD